MTDLSNVAVGTVLPHRSPSPVEVDTITRVARRAETLGFVDLWVTENVVDQAYSFDPIPLLTHAAAVTTSIRVGIAVMVLPVRHPVHVAQSCATLDHLSGGRFTLGVGIGREHHYREFGVPMTRRVARFKESIAIMRALWSEPTVTIKGDFYELDEVTIPLKPVQSPFPVWIGSAHPDAVRRAANIGDGWIGAGSQPRVACEQSLKLLHQTLQTNGRDPADFPVSKRLSWSSTKIQNAHDAGSQIGLRPFMEMRHSPTRLVSLVRKHRLRNKCRPWSTWASIICC